MSFASVKSKIASILSADLVGSGKPLASVQEFFDQQPEVFPMACVDVAGGSLENRLDTSADLLTMSFVIRVYVTQAKNDKATSDRRISIMQSVLTTLRKRANIDTLDGTVQIFSIVSIEPFQTEAEMPLVGFDIVCQASKIEALG